MDGAELAKAIRTRLADEVRELGDVALATVLVGDDPASQVYIKYKHRACEEIGLHALRPSSSGRDDRGGAPRPRRSSERRRRSRRNPCPDAAPGAHRREHDHRLCRAGQGRGRLLTREPRSAAARRATAHRRDASRDHDAPRQLPGQHPGRPRCGDRTEQSSSGSRSPSSFCKRTPRSRCAIRRRRDLAEEVARAGHRGRRRRRSSPRAGGVDQGGRRDRGRRDRIASRRGWSGTSLPMLPGVRGS